jgi:hypothetical protein
MKQTERMRKNTIVSEVLSPMNADEIECESKTETSELILMSDETLRREKKTGSLNRLNEKGDIKQVSGRRNGSQQVDNEPGCM